MTSAKQVYEWVKTGHWSKRQFMEWVAATEESSAIQEPKREWVGLTDEEIEQLGLSNYTQEIAKAIEAKLKEKNT